MRIVPAAATANIVPLFAIALLGAALVGFVPRHSGAAQAAPAEAAPQSAGMPFLPHRAIYELSLGNTTGDKAPTAAKGLIGYEFTGSACEGYVTKFRQMTAIDPSEGAQRVSDMRSSTFEDGGAKDFRFKIETKVDDMKQDELDGRATRAGNGAISVALAQPKREKFQFQPGVVFPTEHLERVIAAAKAGKHDLAVQAYDGSETGSKIYDTFTVIGDRLDKPSDDPGGADAALAKVARWPVTISYYDANKTDGLPSYQLSFDIYENGVSRALRLDYGNFVLNGKLTRFEALSAAPCKG